MSRLTVIILDFCGLITNYVVETSDFEGFATVDLSFLLNCCTVSGDYAEVSKYWFWENILHGELFSCSTRAALGMLVLCALVYLSK